MLQEHQINSTPRQFFYMHRYNTTIEKKAINANNKLDYILCNQSLRFISHENRGDKEEKI